MLKRTPDETMPDGSCSTEIGSTYLVLNCTSHVLFAKRLIHGCEFANLMCTIYEKISANYKNIEFRPKLVSNVTILYFVQLCSALVMPMAKCRRVRQETRITVISNYSSAIVASLSGWRVYHVTVGVFWKKVL